MSEITSNHDSSQLNHFNQTTLGAVHSLWPGEDSGFIRSLQHNNVAVLNSEFPLVQSSKVGRLQSSEQADDPLRLNRSLSISGNEHHHSSSLGSETVGDIAANRIDPLLNSDKLHKKKSNGNALKTAQQIKLTNQWNTIEDSVGSSDRLDFYRFKLDTGSSFHLALAGEQNNVDVVLLNASGKVVKDLSGPFSKKRAALHRALNAGTYYLKVTGHDDDTSYRLSLSGDPGGARRSAQPMSANQQAIVNTVGSTDRSDMYRFVVDKKSTVQCDLKGLKGNADLALMNSQGHIIQTSRHFGKKDESITATLEQGTYYAKVTGWGKETKYRLKMLAQEVPVLPIPKPSAPGTGVFTVGETGKVSIDYLFDGSALQGELAIFNLKGMEQYGIGSKRYMQEAMLRALGNSADSGYVAILDQTEGAKFNSTAGEPNFNAGEYRGTKTFTMNPGDRFGIMLVPNGTTPDALFNSDLTGDQRPLFSMPEANLESAIQFVQIADVTDGNAFAFEDTSLTMEADRDFDDVVFQMKGVAGNSSLLNSIVAPEKDWRTSQIGQQIEQYIYDPLDLAGNSLNTAYRVRPSTGGKIYSGWVGSIDSDDYYTMHLGARHELRLSLGDLSADANVEIVDPSGAVIKKVVNSPTSKEDIDTVLESGVYRIRVTNPTGVGTPFNLNISITPLIEGTEGLTTTGSEAEFELDLAESIPLINADEFGTRPNNINQNPLFPGIDGRGYNIVVIDSGIDENHTLFGPNRDGRNGADRIVYQEDFTSGQPNHQAVDNAGHGTHVASIAAGDTGVAPEAGIIALKVSSAPSAQNLELSPEERARNFFSEVESALQKVLELSNQGYNIASVNMSFSYRGDVEGIDRLFTTDNPQELQQALIEFGISDELSELARRDIIVVSSAGNLFSPNRQEGVGYPSADPHSLVVGSVLDGGNTATINGKTAPADTISPTSQRESTTKFILAPGEVITAAKIGGGTTAKSGTSMAVPHVAGMIVLAQQIAEPIIGRKLHFDELRDLLYSSGKPITDPVTGKTFRRADMLALRNAIIEKVLPEVTLEIPDILVNGIHTNNGGDQDFDGNGPRITINTRAKIEGDKLHISGEINFYEWEAGRPKDDFTSFEGRFDTELKIYDLITQQYKKYTDYALNTDQILSSDSSYLETIDVELHSPQIILQKNDNLVYSYKIEGDTYQSGVIAVPPDQPAALIEFNPVRVRLRGPNGELVEDYFQIPPSDPLIGHVAGDYEFAGHGPDIYIKTEVVADTATVLRPKILAKFKETEPDYTEFFDNFKGQGVDIRYQPSLSNKTYADYVIDTILGDTKDVLSTTDVDIHSEQTISLDGDEFVSTYRIMGDSDGDEHPYVALHFNPIRVQLRKPN